MVQKSHQPPPSVPIEYCATEGSGLGSGSDSADISSRSVVSFQAQTQALLKDPDPKYSRHGAAPVPVPVSDTEAQNPEPQVSSSSKAPLNSSIYSLRSIDRPRKRKQDPNMSDDDGKDHNISDGEEDDLKGSKGGSGGKSRRELPSGAVATLKAWLLSPEHFTHPYPTPQDQIMLMQKTGIDKKQLKNWFTNARRRIWKPMLKKQLEEGKLAATGAGGGAVAVQGVVVSGLMSPTVPVAAVTSTTSDLTSGGAGSSDPNASVQMMHAHYQQAMQQTQQQQQQQQPQGQQGQVHQHYDVYGNPIYVKGQQQQKQQQSQMAAQSPSQGYTAQFYSQTPYGQQQQQQQGSQAQTQQQPQQAAGPTPADTAAAATKRSMNKTDSHAVLMELFARDQDLVRQATESAKFKQGGASPTAVPQETTSSSGSSSQHPMKMGQGKPFGGVPTLNSWPHFSSVSSLNNLGTMTGVKSITSLSGADLASQGNLNKMGNLAQVKSSENVGRTDSFAFLEFFFDDRASGAAGGMQRGVKREREEDNDVGLCLDGDEGAGGGGSSASGGKQGQPANGSADGTTSAPASGVPRPAPLPSDGIDRPGMGSDTGTLKRAYDDALAARGLMAVSRSSEKLTDLALPAKMQKTLSQEFLRQSQSAFGGYSYVGQQVSGGNRNAQQGSSGMYSNQPTKNSQQYPGQHPGQHPGQQQQQQQQSALQQQQQTVQYQNNQEGAQGGSSGSGTDKGSKSTFTGNTGSSVEVPSQTKCALCGQTNVDTQLRPCGHMLHERCLKPSLQNPTGQPKCPIDNIPMQSALLAVPTDESALSSGSSQQQSQQHPWGTGVSSVRVKSEQ